MARFIKVADASHGREYRINVDWIVGFTEGSEPGLTVISFGGGPVALPGAPSTTLVARVQFGTLANTIATVHA